MPVKSIQALFDVVGQVCRDYVVGWDALGLLHAWFSFSIYGRNGHVPSIGLLCRVDVNAFPLVQCPAAADLAFTRHNPVLGIRPEKSRSRHVAFAASIGMPLESALVRTFPAPNLLRDLLDVCVARA